MWPYFIPVIFIVFMQFHFTGMPKVKSKAYIASLLLLLFAGIRGNGDGDYFAYLNAGQAINTIYDIFNNSIPMDTGYPVLAYFVNQFHLPAQTIIILMNAISIGCMAVTIRRYSCIPILSVLVFLPFFYQFDMQAARTAVSIGIFMLSIPYVIERKPLKFSLVLAMSVLFHPSALIGIFLYFLPKLKLNYKIMTIILIAEAAWVTLIGVDRLAMAILRTVRLEKVYQRFSAYVNDTTYGYAANVFDVRILLVILLFIVASGVITKPSDLERLMINAAFACAFIMIFFSEHTVFVYRLSAFYNVFTILLVPTVLSHIGKTSTHKYRYLRVHIIVVLFYAAFAFAYAYRIGKNAEYKVFELMYWH